MKRISIIKRLFVIVLIFLLSINGFAAAVSDNDGASFITKGEFDTLKASFQKQIDEYNNSIDSKIDNAISSYLTGIEDEKEVYVRDNVSLITFPCKVIDRNPIIKGVHKPAAGYGYEPAWAPGYMVYECYFRGYMLYAQRIKRDGIDKIGNWFWGDVSGSYFKVKGTAKNIKVDANLFFYAEGFNRVWNGTKGAYDVGGDEETGILYFDQKTMNNAWGGASRTSYTRAGSLYADFEIDKKSTEDWQYVNDWVFVTAKWDDAKNNFVVGNAANGYDYLGENVNYAMWGSPDHTISEYKGANVLSHSESSIETIDMIYNNATDSADSNFAPVAYTTTDASGNKIPYIWYTNKKWNRIYDNNHANWPRAQWKERVKQANVTGGICGMITLGENIETEYENTGRSWTNKSAIGQDRLIYDFTGAGKTISNHKMTKGIPIYTVPSTIREGEKCVIKLNMDLGADTTNKYIAVSTNPIDIEGSTSVPASKGTKIIKTLNGTNVNDYKAKLVQGENKIEISDINAGNVIYVKILWIGSDADNQVIIKEIPTFTIKTK